MRVKLGIQREVEAVSVDAARWLLARELGVPVKEVEPVSWRVAPRRDCPLTDTELRVVELVGHGLSYKQLAELLDCSPSTVRSHLHHTYTKLELASSAQAYLECVRHGWLTFRLADPVP